MAQSALRPPVLNLALTLKAGRNVLLLDEPTNDLDVEILLFWFEGNFADYEKNKIEWLGVDAARPHAVTYRKLNRD